jgi:hypothetical protein
MTQNGDNGSLPRRTRRSRLFHSRPDALLVDEWVPNITLPPPPDAVLEEDDPAVAVLDEHGLPTFEDEPEEAPREPGGPARLFVGLGQRGASVAPSEEPDGEDEFDFSEHHDFFVAELRLPRPEDRLPFRIGGRGEPAEGDDEDDSGYVLDAAEASDPQLGVSDLEAPFSVSLDAPDPVHLGSFGDEDDDEDHGDELSSDLEADLAFEGELDDSEPSEDLDDLVSGGLPPLTLQPSPARVPLGAPRGDRASPSLSMPDGSRPREEGVPGWASAGRPVVEPPPAPPAPPRRPQAAASDGAPDDRLQPEVVLRTRPFWTRGRRMPVPKPASAPVFQPRDAPEPSPLQRRLFSWPSLALLVSLLLVASALLAWRLLSA